MVLGLVALVVVAACQDTATATAGETGSSTESSGSTGGGPETSGGSGGSSSETLADTTTLPETSESSTEVGTSEASTSESSGTPTTEGSSEAGSSSSEGPGFICGNGIIEGEEACDGDALGGLSCFSLGYEDGEIACTDDCSIDLAACVLGGCCTQHEGSAPGCDDPVCGAAVCEIQPECCDDQWYNDCAYIAFEVCASCHEPDVCGNHIVDGAELCDHEDLGTLTCADYGFDGGFLECLGDCASVGTSGCQLFDGDCCAPDGTPGCEDIDCANTACELLPDCCFGWDQSCADIANGFCEVCGGGEGDCCTEHAGPGCDDLQCVGLICLADPMCCTDWDAVCAADAATTCDVCAVCGDDFVQGAEQCDGTDLDAQTCESQGFIGGSLACGALCTFETSACIENGGGDCCSANGAPGCADDLCVTDVCYADESCCSSGWEQDCADLAMSICGVCGGIPQPLPCAEQDLDNVLGLAVASGDTTPGDDDVTEACGDGGGPDHVMIWTAPADGEYGFDSIGSSFDTVISIRLECSSEYLCDDNSGGGTDAAVSAGLLAGTTILISISGPPGEVGSWVLNITAL